MFKQLCIFCLLSTFQIFSDETNLPEIIDFAKSARIENGYYATLDINAWQLGCYAFNYAPELTPVFARLKQKYKIDAVVETGTFNGGTTALFALLFDDVHTIELVYATFQYAQSRLQQFPNVQCHLGSSEKVLKDLLPALKNKFILFYLDAHWESFWPLLDELEEISKTHKDNCIIVIDDFKVPGRSDIPYDYYGSHECSVEYIKSKLDKIYTSYTSHYLIPKSTMSRAKYIAIPTQKNRRG